MVDESAARREAEADRWRRFVHKWVIEGYLRRDAGLLATMVTDDFTQEDPMNFGHMVRGPAEFGKMLEDTFTAFPDTLFVVVGPPYFGLESDTVVVPWRATGTFSGPLVWGPPDRRKAFSLTGRRFDFSGLDRLAAATQRRIA